MDNIAGPPVEGANFFGRQTAVVALRSTLEHHDVLLLGPRRIGKTSMARAIMQVLLAEDWKAIEINVASCTDEKAFVKVFAKALEAEAKSRPAKVLGAIGARCSALLDRITKVQLPGSAGFEVAAAKSEDWSDVASDTLRLLGEIPGRWLIYVDELPIMLFTMISADPVNGIARVRRFLDWFRNDVRAMPECKSVRWLVTGSVGLDTLVQRFGMADTINSLRHESLAPFEASIAQQFLEKLAASYAIPFVDGDTAYFVDAIGWPQPYYLQRAFNQLRESWAVSSLPMRQQIDAAIAQLSQPDVDNDFQWWRQRLALQLGPVDGAHADALLVRVAQAREGATPTFLLSILEARLPNANGDEQRDKFIQLRDILLRDAYWWRDDSRGAVFYRFKLEPLRQWWLKRSTL